MLPVVAAALIFVLACVLAWAAGFAGMFSASVLTLVRCVVVLLGLLAAGIAAWWLRRRAANANAPAESNALRELLQQAETRLRASQHGSKGSLRSLPVLYVLGEPNSAKTTAVVKSGLEPELLAGEVYRERDIISTPLANVWLSQGTVIIEAAAALSQDAGMWQQLLRDTQPGSLQGALRGGPAPSRAAVVCIACDQVLAQGGAEALKQKASALSDRLREMTRVLGSPASVYLLVTKLDRVPGFSDFVRNLAPAEANSLLGQAITMPEARANYAETQHAGIGTAFDGIVYSLAKARVDLLQRESDPTRVANAYEFPREFRKLRDPLVSFLTELGRPSQLNINPRLRGFFFTGVRAVLREQTGFEAVQPSFAAAQNTSATGIFSAVPAAPHVAPAPSTRTAEKTAHWTFLQRFFPEAVFRDVAQSAPGRSSHVTAVRRWAYGGVAALLLLYLLLLSLSWINNTRLEQTLAADAAALSAEPPQGGQLATTAQLAHLDHLRLTLQRLEGYAEQGAPLGYRWGLYRGSDLLRPAQQLYFEHFQALLLSRAETNLLSAMNALPAAASSTPSPGTSYNGMYAALRAYLITTVHPEKSTPEFLAPVLETYWESATGAQDSNVSAEQRQLAKAQMSFYATVLPKQNPYQLTPANTTVTHTRGYLASFGGFERIYAGMLSAADKTGSAVDFNPQHPGSATVVLAPHVVPAAFTQQGFGFMQNALAHPEQFFQGEAWVLGEQAPSSIDPVHLRAQLGARYRDDFLTQWQNFLKDATVVRYRDLKDAGDKLTVLSGNGSPLLALFATISANTSVEDPAIRAAFQPAQVLVPGTAKDAYIGPGNKAYMDGLLALDAAIHQATGAPGGSMDPAAAAPISSAAAAATIAARQVAQTFHLDPKAHGDALTLALLEAPITATDALVRGMGPAAANAGGKSFCASFASLFSKAPFNPQAKIQATPAEVTALLQPGTGALAQFYNANLKPLLVQQGTSYVAAPNAATQVTPTFLRFFNRAQVLSQDLFPSGATAPSLAFTLKPLPGGGIQSSQFRVDNQTLNNTEGLKQFTWNAATAQSASLTANSLPVGFEGPWAVFLLLERARIQKTGAAYEVSFPLEVANTPVKAPDGTPVVARYELAGPGAEVLVPNTFAGLRCVAEVAK